MLDRETYEKEYIRLMDSVRTEHKGEFNCYGVVCEDCPIGGECAYSDDIGCPNIFDIIEAVEKWSKEHPVTSNADKFREVFGAEPKNNLNDWCCPASLGFAQRGCATATSCNDCKEKFWNSEYTEPRKEKE